MKLPPAFSEALRIKSIPIRDVARIKLYKSFRPGSFREFLVTGRLRQFQTMLFLREHLEDRFFVGYESVTINEYVESEVEDKSEIKLIKDLGLQVLPTSFRGREIFDSFLAGLALLQVDAKDYIANETQKMHPEYPYYLATSGQFIILQEPLTVITESEIFAERDGDNLQKLIDLHNREFEPLLDESRKGVSHEVYLDWLLKWFPGLIKVRSIGDLS